MALLHEIQAALLDENVGVGGTLLKLRFLASKLGSDVLEEWVKHETEGYSDDANVPNYRVAGIVYHGTFVDRFRQLNNVSIPSIAIREFCGVDFVDYKIRDGLSVIDKFIASSTDNSKFTLDTGNVKLRLEGKIYPGMACIEVNGIFDIASFVRIQNTVRAKVLDLTLELEKSVPSSAKIIVGKATRLKSPNAKEKVANLTQQIFYGDVTNISNHGSGSEIHLNITKGSKTELIAALEGQGIPTSDAIEIADIAASERPEGLDKPFGKKAAAWLAEKAKIGAVEAWGIGKAIGTEVAKEALKQYYGLK